MPLFCLALTALAVNSPERIALEGAWRLTQTERKISIAAAVPGVVQTDLMHAGLIPNPYFGMNEKAVQWVSDLPWSYSRSFDVPAAFLRNRRVILRCEGLDTFAAIRVNGQPVAKSDNMYRTWEFDAKPFLKTGKNSIQIDFETLASFLKRNEDRPKQFDKPVQEGGKPYIRKPAFQGGWDFAPKLLTMGIWRKIGLVGWNAARLTDIGVAQDHRQKNQVGLNVKLTADVASATSAHTTLLLKGRKIAESNTKLAQGVAQTRLTVRNPQLWWPNEMGPQNLYDVRVELRDSRGQVVDRGSRRIGLRTVTWIPKTDHTALALVVNGRHFFAKGSNWVPFDSLLREDPEKERARVQQAADAHMNLLRLWGGGYYVNDAFLDACDEKGILAWFEFGYADSPYPSFDPTWLANAKAEAEDNVRRTRNHPSIAVYSGNNEVIDRLAEKTSSWQMSREEYALLFRKTLRDVVRELAPNAAYTPGSPEIGDHHYWDVWHGSATFASYRTLHGFMSEYGFQAFPVPRTIDQYTTPAARTSVTTPEMVHHGKNWRDGNTLIVSTLLRSYRQPKDFDSTLWVSQILQAEGILTGVEHWRRDWPNSTASLVWQYNDPWPGVSWSMIDYYGRPKALYYRLKHAYAPVALSGLADATGKVDLWIANDRPQAEKGQISWTLTRIDGTPIEKGAKAVAIPAGTSSLHAVTLDRTALAAKENPSNLLLWAKLTVPGEVDSTTLVLFSRPKELSLIKPQIQSTISTATGGYRVTLTSSHPALWTWIDLAGMDAKFSDNFVHLRSGEPVTILVQPTGKTTLAAVRRALQVRSLYDTYLPGTEANPVTRPEVDGRIVADADHAEILGDTAILEVGAPSNIGNWTRPSDSLRWIVRGAKPGRYAVTAMVGIPVNEEGSTFSVDVDGERVEGTVPGTKSWTDYREISLGTVTISKLGTTIITLRPIKMKDVHVMNLRNVTLKPAG